MTKLLLIGVSASAMALSGCTSTTNTGSVGVQRQQFMLVSSQQVLQMSAQTYRKGLAQARAKGTLDRDTAQLNRLRRIANKLIPHVGVYRPDARSWNWEVHTIKSDSVNAFVLPGGKVLFFSGIIDKLGLTDDEIAAIMGHEMAHALREHTRERMSSAYATQMGIGIAASAFGLSQGEAQLATIAGDLGISRPHSRVQESEADLMGLELMARAGYNPQAAITLWQKMQKNGRGSTPQFLSTHPTSTNRISALQAHMSQVIPLYRSATGQSSSSSINSNNRTPVTFQRYQPR